MAEQTIASLHTVFVIIYLQEFAWVCAPLLISGNVFLHACIKNAPLSSRLLSGVVFCFFLVTGVCLAIALYLAHSRALCRKWPRYLLPYIIIKFTRIIALATVSILILLSPALITTYFYASVYGLFECVAGAVALEVTGRSWRVLQKTGITSRRRQSASDTQNPTLGLSKQTFVQET